MKRVIAGALFAVLATGSARACEDMQGGGTVVSNAQFPVRGYSYWTDKSPVTITWNTGVVAASASPDDNGEWAVVVTAPTAPGTYKLIARQNREDSEPVIITVSVVVPESPEAKTLIN